MPSCVAMLVWLLPVELGERVHRSAVSFPRSVRPRPRCLGAHTDPIPHLVCGLTVRKHVDALELLLRPRRPRLTLFPYLYGTGCQRWGVIFRK